MLFVRYCFPCNVQRLYIEKWCFFRIFPSEVPWLRLTLYDPLDDSLYVLRLCLSGFVSIFSCPSMDFGFSLTSVVFFVFAPLCTLVSVLPRYLLGTVFPCNLQRLATNTACFSAEPFPSDVPRIYTEQVCHQPSSVAIMYPNITPSPRFYYYRKTRF